MKKAEDTAPTTARAQPRQPSLRVKLGTLSSRRKSTYAPMPINPTRPRQQAMVQGSAAVDLVKMPASAKNAVEATTRTTPSAWPDLLGSDTAAPLLVAPERA